MSLEGKTDRFDYGVEAWVSLVFSSHMSLGIQHFARIRGNSEDSPYSAFAVQRSITSFGFEVEAK